ncbi:TetR family transcriptional regulator [Ectothiorhodospira shaposhnikovii]|uniref:TetR family transcriptional regulator n=1 Tax=Ectothiorhodospira shaposhnikovii TaxID=1054 RepID=UPI0019034D90|nr:TetR family transcriptional regulator [Ectothiorhodospira shaposhnikovii]
MRRTKEEAEQTRALLLDAAEKVFLEQGVSRASLEAIAREAGMTRGAIYWHFRDKAALYGAMLDRVRLPLERLRDEFVREPDADPVEVIERLCLAALETLAGDAQVQRVYTIVFHRREREADNQVWRDAELEGRRRAARVMLECFQEAQAAGRLRPGVTPEMGQLTLELYFTGLFYAWLLEPEYFDLLKDAPAMIRRILDGLLLPPG